MNIGIGINSWVWCSPFTDDQAALVNRAAEIGFDLLEIAVEDPAHFQSGRVAQALRDTGLRSAVCGAFGPGRDLASDLATERQASMDYLRDTLALCRQWGAAVLAGPMYSTVGKRRHLSVDQRRAEWTRAVAGLREAGKMAADSGVVLAVEPLNRFETDLVNTAAQGIAMVDEVDHPNVRLHLDTFHMGIEEVSVLEAVRAAGSRLAHVHACENDRGTPGRGQVAWAELFRGLRETDFRGDVVIESFTPECEAIAAAAAIWRPLAESQERLAIDGLAFLRGCLVDEDAD